MKVRYLSLILLSSIAQAQTPMEKMSANAISENYWSIHNPKNQLFSEMNTANPILRWSTSQAESTSISLDGMLYNEKEQYDYQKGDRTRYFGLTAISQVKISKNSLVWGGASYRNGETKNIRFNDNLDYELIYPYIMADTLGGSMNTERYMFNGGYLHKLSSGLLLTAELDYRAVMGARQKDPRPKNTVSDLKFKFGIGHQFNTNYIFGLSLFAQKYKQDSNIQFMSSIKNVPIYHLSGLGERIPRFDGTFTSSRHDGHSLGASLGVNQEKSLGWHGNINYNHLKIEKIMTSINNLPLQEIKEDKINLTAGYLKERWGVQFLANWKKRKGYENLYGSPQDGQYSIIATNQPYTHEVQNISINGYWQTNLGKSFWYIQPSIGYINDKERYKDPAQIIEFSGLATSLKSTFYWSTSKLGSISFTQNIGYLAFLSQNHQLEMVSTNPLSPLINQKKAHLDLNRIDMGMNLHWELPFSFFSMKVYTEAEWHTLKLDKLKAINQGVLKLGLVF